jgi:hypothetical protein
MINQHANANFQQPPNQSSPDEKSLHEMLLELGLLQQGSQILAGFLILLPFSEGFEKIAFSGRWVFIVAFISSICTLVCFNAPAVQHRLEYPLKNRNKFKVRANKIVILGTFSLSITLTSTTHLVTKEALGPEWSPLVTTLVAVMLIVIWWLIPLSKRLRSHQYPR